MKKILTIFIIILLIYLFPISVNAHSNNLEIEYDECIPSQYNDSLNIGDGYNEKWYMLTNDNKMRHIENNQYSIITIRYYFSEDSTDGKVSWTHSLTQEQITEIQLGLENSMKKWNNVYFYSNNGDYYTKKKIVNIIEGTEENHNVSIRPIKYGDIVQTKQDALYMEETKIVSDENDNIEHSHCPR